MPPPTSDSWSLHETPTKWGVMVSEGTDPAVLPAGSHATWTITRVPRPGRPPRWVATRGPLTVSAPSLSFLQERLDGYSTRAQHA